MSTPVRVGRSAAEITESPIARVGADIDYAILPRVANVPHWIRKPKDKIYHDKPIKTYKYVDDQVNTSKVNMRRATLLVNDGVFFKDIVDLKTQALLTHIANKAKAKGMAINAAKTGLMLVSAASSFDPRVRIKLEGETVTGQERMKILGVTVDKDASFRSHVEDLAARMRSKTWALAKLRKKGLPEKDLICTYKTLIRPTVEYASPAWHSLLTAGQAADLERQQTQALKNIFGPKISARKMRNRADIDLLSKRRECAAKKFAQKCKNNPRCESWFVERGRPSYPRRSSLTYPHLREETARTDRHRNSPKNYLIRKINEDA